jgi:hypothetical protein
MEVCGFSNSSSCVRKQWNTAASKKACAINGTLLIHSPAIDIVDGQIPSFADRFAILTKAGQKKDGSEERAGLMKIVELAIGMPVMVTLNVHTELDIANGSRGEIKGIILHPDDNHGHQEKNPIWELKHPPLYVLVELKRTKIGHLSNLPSHVIPISPITKTFNITIGGINKTVSCTQLPITPAHAFTDY